MIHQTEKRPEERLRSFEKNLDEGQVRSPTRVEPIGIAILRSTLLLTEGR